MSEVIVRSAPAPPEPCDGLKGLPEVVPNVWPHTIADLIT